MVTPVIYGEILRYLPLVYALHSLAVKALFWEGEVNSYFEYLVQLVISGLFGCLVVLENSGMFGGLMVLVLCVVYPLPALTFDLLNL